MLMHQHFPLERSWTQMFSSGVEERTVGSLSFGVIGLFLAATGGVIWIIAIIFFYGLEQAAKIMADAWVGFWSEDRFSVGKDNLKFYLGVYCALAVGFGMVTLIRALTLSFGVVRSIQPHSAF
jgi:hypothetical protein